MAARLSRLKYSGDEAGCQRCDAAPIADSQLSKSPIPARFFRQATRAPVQRIMTLLQVKMRHGSHHLAHDFTRGCSGNESGMGKGADSRRRHRSPPFSILVSGLPLELPQMRTSGKSRRSKSLLMAFLSKINSSRTGSAHAIRRYAATRAQSKFAASAA